MKSGRFHIMCLKVKDRFAPILSQTLGLNIEETQADLKSGISFFVFSKTLQTKGDVSVIISLRKQNSTRLILTSSIPIGSGRKQQKKSRRYGVA